jgi:hypothetical protein
MIVMQAQVAGLLLAAALLTLPGCVRVIPAVAQPPAAMARVEKLALQIPLQLDGVTAYASTTWNQARLTIGRHDETMAPVTYTFEAIRVGSSSAGLRGVGQFPILPPGDGYWLQVELIQTRGDGLERIVGRGIQGTEDDIGVALAAGGNLARVPIVPTVAGALLALSPVRPPDPPRSVESWETRDTPADTTVREVPASADMGTVREVGGWDTTPRRTLEQEDPVYYDTSGDDDSDDDSGGDDNSSSSYEHDDAPAVMQGDLDTGMALQSRNPI